MPIGKPESFRGGQGLVEWTIVLIFIATGVAVWLWF